MANVDKKFVNRELSWLEFNGRVLQEAADENTPLIERVKFLGIFSNNLDEFFRVRVATLNRLLDYERRGIENMNSNPRRTLKEINRIDALQQKEFARIFRKLVRELAHEGIHIVNEKELSEEHGAFVRRFFNDHVRSQLFPIMLSNLKSASLVDKSIYLAIRLSGKNNAINEQFAVIRVPAGPLSRFVLLPSTEGGKYIILLDDVIRYCLDDIFSIFGYHEFSAYTFKFTRDAELDIDNDVSKSFLEIMTESLKQRKLGAPVRFIYDKNMPSKLLGMIKQKLDISESDTLSKSGRYHNFKDFMSFPDIGRTDLLYAPVAPLEHRRIPRKESILGIIRERDIMLHYPYQSFRYIIDLLREASIDPQVRSIKMTLYRVARDSNVINALINAARNGKSVTVFMELQARFDEEANIYWAGKMQEEGIKLIQGIPGFKVHCKLLLIRRKESDKNVYYANVGTGNFNEQTARVYADDSLLTSDPRITADVNSVFHLFESKYNPPKFHSLIVAPFHMRNFFIRLINNEIKHAEAGREAWCIIKLNNLVDDKIVKKLYQASQAGVKVRIICRGTCTMIPGIKGMSDNVEVISIVDRFLEHSRVLVFNNGGDEKYYISSADWMVRNLDNRIEVACPVNDKGIQQELKTMLLIQLKDNTKARIVNHEQANFYKDREKLPKIRSQVEIYNYLKGI
ncbi:MAG: polyphosphate kinase 1 [Bacteroidales bacterium]|nr:polyphosphate kinase 1 [Bacteroidales bacterium]